MCEFSEKLIAWLDHELPMEACTVFERHVRGCTECRHAAEVYRAVNVNIDAYCETAIRTVPEKRGWFTARVWRSVFVATAAAAAVVLVVFLAPSIERLLSIDALPADEMPVFALQRTSIPSMALEKTPALARASTEAPTLLRRSPLVHRATPWAEPPKRSESLWPNQTPVYIAIPADALFPPG